MVKKVLALIYGNPEEFPMEHRILNFILALCVFVSLFFLVFSIIQQLGLFFNLFLTGIILFTLILFYLSRIKRLYYIPLWVIVLFLMSILGIFFFSRGGASKGVLYLALIITLIIAILFRKTSRIILLISLVLEITSLLAIEFLYPHFIYEDNRIHEIFTIGAALFIVILSASILIIIFSRNYDYEKQCVDEANTKLNQLNNLKNDFIANITHDFRNPLTVVLNLAELEIMKKNGEDKETYNAIYLNSLKLKDSIDKLLDLAKMDVQGVKLKIQKLNITDFLTDLESAKVVAENLRREMESTRLSWGEKDIRFTCSFGIASLKSNEKELCKALCISSLKELYNIKNPREVDWEKIKEKKKILSSILFDVADTSLYSAKQSCCKDCGFCSLDDKVFSNGECGNKNIVMGRNKSIVR